MGINDLTKQRVAIKIVKKSMLKASGKKLFKKLKQEIGLMKKLDHPNVVSLIDVIKTRDAICMVMEYCSKGEYFDLISRQERVHNLIKIS